jgi:hypothetical protein
MHRRMPVSKPCFSAVSMISCAVPMALALGDELRELRILRRRRLRQRMIGAIAMNFAPNSVSAAS